MPFLVGNQLHYFPSLVCKDGTTLSVQVGETLYCSPRDNHGPYSQVEVGFPSVDPPKETWEEYSDGSYPSDVYGYVPVSLVQEFIDSHGGIDLSATINRWVNRIHRN